MFNAATVRILNKGDEVGKCDSGSNRSVEGDFYKDFSLFIGRLLVQYHTLVFAM